MDNNFEKTYYQSEKSHWWGRTCRELIVHWISKLPKNPTILNIGCSSGALLTDLKENGYQNLQGVDVSETVLALARDYGHERVQVMDGGNITFASEKFDVVIASDCLEHIADDKPALDHWYRILKPGGTLILFVQAFMFLWSIHDEANHHRRRYTKKQLAALIKAAGFEIQRNGFWNFFLFPGIATLRIVQRLLPMSSNKVDDIYDTPVFINSALSGMIHTENKLLKYLDLPIGISTYVVAQRPHLEDVNG